MKQRFILVLFIIILFSCKKDETLDQLDSTAYYFEATLSDGRTFKLKEHTQHSASPIHLQAGFTRIELGATKFTVIGGLVSDLNAHPLGHDFFIWDFTLYNAEKEGTYEPDFMTLVAKEGAEHYTYVSGTGDSTTPAIGKVNMKISKIEVGTLDAPGSFQGTFSGTVMGYRESVPNVETPLQISGKFRLALTQ